jgi:hypothetical protein
MSGEGMISRHPLTRPMAAAADVQRGDVVAVTRRTRLNEELSVRTKASPRRFDHWQSDLLQVVEFQDTAHLGLLTRPRLRALLRPERIIDPRQPVEGESFQH